MTTRGETLETDLRVACSCVHTCSRARVFVAFTWCGVVWCWWVLRGVGGVTDGKRATARRRQFYVNSAGGVNVFPAFFRRAGKKHTKK